VPIKGSTKPVEDKIDAVLCAYVGACWWLWATQRNRLYGNKEDGYIVVPNRPYPVNGPPDNRLHLGATGGFDKVRQP
jgi:predicted RNase H-like nuclease